MRTADESSYSKDVFINCPFDAHYKKVFEAIVFAVFDCGFQPRCALELDDGAQIRFSKISRIIGDCRFGIHDISKTELDESNGLPRFNMPLELGMFLGAKQYGSKKQKKKVCLILDRENYRLSSRMATLLPEWVSIAVGRSQYCIITPKTIPAIKVWRYCSSLGSGLCPPANNDVAIVAEIMYARLCGTLKAIMPRARSSWPAYL